MSALLQTRSAARGCRETFGRRVAWLLVLATCFIAAPSPSAQPLRETFKRVSSSVVVVETTRKEVSPLVPGRTLTVGGVASGVLISNDGKVMTAAHAVQTAETIRVVFDSGERIPARVLGSEPPADVALLQLASMPREARIAALGDSDTVEAGDQVFVVGAPFGMTHTLTVGYVSARRRPDASLGVIGPLEFFQTDAAINQGNSGGPMFNLDGEVVGIVSHIVSLSGGSEGLGFAVTCNTARQLLLEQRSFWSGLEGYLLHGDLARVFNLPQPAGVLVERVGAGSPAAWLGIRHGTMVAAIGDEEMVVGGDVVLAVQGVRIEGDGADYQRIRERLAALTAGDEMIVRVLRGGEVVELRKPYRPDLLVPGPALRPRSAGEEKTEEKR